MSLSKTRYIRQLCVGLSSLLTDASRRHHVYYDQIPSQAIAHINFCFLIERQRTERIRSGWIGFVFIGQARHHAETYRRDT